MVEHVRNVQIQLPIVMYVHQQQNVQHVQIHIIQLRMEQVVLYVHQNVVVLVTQQLVFVQNVKLDIICQMENVMHVDH